ncbi:MAG: TIR domain-containing protein [Candidatus Bathyarchaeia archaeon]
MRKLVTVFVAHSSKDERLIHPIANILRWIGVEPYLAGLEDPVPIPLPAKLDRAIGSSVAMFAFLTPNVAEDRRTRDVVNWEISSAYAKRKPIYVFAEKGVNIPLMINYITVYATYDPMDQESLDRMTDRVRQIADEFKKIEDIAKAAFNLVLLFLGLWFLRSLSTD